MEIFANNVTMLAVKLLSDTRRESGINNVKIVHFQTEKNVVRTNLSVIENIHWNTLRCYFTC